MRIKRSIITALLVLSCMAPTYPQEGKGFKDTVTALVQQTEPKWTLEQKESFDLQKGADYDAVYASWKTPIGQADMFVFVFVSIDLARTSYPKAFVQCIDGSDCVDKVQLSTKATNLGDENRMWYAPKVGLTGIIFRKERFVAQISAPSPEIAEKLANMIAEQMKPKPKS